MTGQLRKIKMELGDECLTLATAKADTVSELEHFRGKAEPTFLLFASGKPICVIHGADGPTLLNTIREKLHHEREIAKGRVKRHTSSVLLNSLVKPEEDLDTDEDLDDIESEQQEKEEFEENSKKEILEAVLLISPTIIAKDRTEAFLSHIVSAGIAITGHVQEELPKEDFHSLLYPMENGKEAEGRDGEKEDIKDEEKEKQKTLDKEVLEKNKDKQKMDESKESVKENVANQPTNKDEYDFWESELGKGPLYMLLIRVEEGCIFDNWNSLLGPKDLRQAQLDDPDSLVAQFGERSLPVPAWLPECSELQQRLRTKFFPTPDEALPRLLLLHDQDDHQQVLATLYQGGVQVLAHTQVVLTEDLVNHLNLSSSAEANKELLGCALLAVVIAGEKAMSVSSDLKSLHLTSSAENSIKEISLVFPDLANDLRADPPPHEDPPTQMQIEQKKETLGM